MSMMTFFVFASVFFVILAMLNGVISMAHGGEHDQRESYALMLRRVSWQAVAVVFVLLALLHDFA
ncbi:MAG: hypothetical protein JO035_02240 [Betaproteobacteria bacterium]|nr:hypothetical protein [Betaproteobacteria bacterium]